MAKVTVPRKTSRNLAKAHTKKDRPTKINLTRPLIEPTRVYSRPEAALVCGVAVVTIRREQKRGRLAYFQRGRRVLHSGQHLLDWLKKGEHQVKGGGQ